MALSPEMQALVSRYSGEDVAEQASSSSSDQGELQAKYDVGTGPTPTSTEPTARSSSSKMAELVSKYSDAPIEEIEAAMGKVGEEEKLGIGGSLIKGAVEGFGTGPVSNLINYAESEGIFKSRDSDAKYGAGFSDESTTPQQRREMIIAHNTLAKRKFLNDYHLNGNAEGHQIAYEIGSMGGSLLDPTTLIGGSAGKGVQLGGRLLHAGILGTTFGGLQGATEGLAQEGEVDPMHTAVTAAIGGLGGVALQGALIEPLSKLFGRTLERGLPIDESDAENLLKTLPEGSEGHSLDPQALADKLNEQMDMFGHTPEEAIRKMHQDGIPSSATDIDIKMAQADEYLKTGEVSSFVKNKDQLELDLKKKKVPKTLDEKMQAANDRYDKMVAEGKIKPSKEVEMGASKIPGEKTVNETRGEDRLHGTSSPIDELQEGYYSPSNIYGQGFYTTDAADIALGYTKKGGGRQPTVYDVKTDVEGNLFDMEAPLDDNIKNVVEQAGLGDYLEEGFLDKAKNLREVYDEFRDISKGEGLSTDTVQEFFNAIRDQLEERGYKGLTHVGGLRTGEKAHKVNIYWSPEADVNLSPADLERFYTQKWHRDPISDQMMESNHLLQEMSDELKEQVRIDNSQSATGSGAATTMPPDIAAVEAVKQGDLPIESTSGKTLSEAEKYENDWQNPDPSFYSSIAETASQTWKAFVALGRPQDTIKKAGKLGEKAVELLDDYERTRLQKLGDKGVDLRKEIFNKFDLDKQEMEQVALYSQKLLPDNAVSQRVKDATAAFKNVFNTELKEFVEQGLISSEKAVKLLDKANKEGYWPRIYNRDLINSPKGRLAFETTLLNTAMKYDQALSVVKSIAGEKNKDRLANYLRKGPNGDEYFLNKDVPKMLWNKLQDITPVSKSSHLEMQRSLPTELDKILQPFLITDPELVVAHYLQDSTERLAAAEVFGNKHELAKKLFSEMHQAGFTNEARLFRETFLTTMRDPMSKAAQSFMDKPQLAKDASRVLRAMQVWKMTLSQMTNLTQLPVYGATMSSKLSGLTMGQRFANSLGGMYKGFIGSVGENALKEEAQRAGSVTDAILVDAFGRLNDPGNSLTGRRLIGPAEFFNNPSTFLKYTGFNWAESINRIGAYHMGKSHVLSLLKNKIKYEGMGNKINPKKLDAVYRGLEELGIPRDIDTSKMSIKMLEEAATKVMGFSDDLGKAINKGGANFNTAVNFTNAAHKLPLFAQSFYGKIMWQLRTFGYNGYHFAKDNVLKPARNGNFLPLMTYLGVGTAVGMPLSEFKRMVLADDSEMTGFEKILQANVSIAGLGIMQDFLKSATYGKQGVLSFIAGPGVSHAADLTSSVGSIYNASVAKGSFTAEPVGKAVLRSFSFPYKKAVMEKLKADKQGFEEKMKRRQNKATKREEELKKRMKKYENM